MAEVVRLAIEVEPDRLTRSRSGAVAGPIWFRSGQVDFPDPGWSDFPVVVLEWWLRSLAQPLSDPTIALRFMDGPVQVVLRDEERTGVLRAHGRRDSSSQEIPLGDTSRRELLEALAIAGHRIVRACEDRGWIDRDVISLRRAVALAKKTEVR